MGKYVVKDQLEIITGDLIKPPIITDSSILVNNLNVEYLNGKRSFDFASISGLTIISGDVQDIEGEIVLINNKIQTITGDVQNIENEYIKSVTYSGSTLSVKHQDDSINNYEIDSGLTGITRDITLTGNGTDEPLGVNPDLLLPSTPENPSNKFLNGNKEWATVPIGAGGFSAPLYFSNEDSDVVGYKKINYTNDEAQIELSGTITNEELLLRTYLYDEPLGLTVIDAGLWVNSFRAKVDKATGVTQLKFEAFVRHSDNTETTLFSHYSQELNNLDYVIIRQDSPQPVFSVSSTDRLGVRIYAKTTSTAAVTIYTTIGDGDASYFTTPIPFRHNLLRGLDYENSGHTGFEPAKGDDDNYVTDAEKVKLNNLSGTNTGDQDLTPYATLSGSTFTGVVLATNLSGTNTGDETKSTIESKLVVSGLTTTSKEVVGAINEVNAKSVDLSGYATLSGATFTGSISATNLSGTNTGDQDLSGLQEKLVSGENLKTINGESLLGSENITITASSTTDNVTITGEGTEAIPFQISEEYQRRINAGI